MVRLAAFIPPADPDLIPGEIPDRGDFHDARNWIAVYRELTSFAQLTLDRLGAEAEPGPGLSPGHGDQRALESHLRRRRSGLDDWEGRLRELRGAPVDDA